MTSKIDVYKEWLGIPEGPRPPDYYTLLRLVQFEDDIEKIRKHYKKLNTHVRKFATGQYSVQSQELLNELAKAMLCLTDAEAKKEYDRKLGRVIDDRDELTGRRPLTAILEDEGVLSADQVNEVRGHAERTGLSLRDAVVQLKYATMEQATRALASELGLAYIDLADIVPQEDALDHLPRNVVRRYTCLPLFISEERVLVACATEPTHELEDEIRIRFGKPMRPVLAAPQAIQEAIEKYYAPGLRQETASSAKASKVTPSQKKNTSVAATQPIRQLTEAEKDERRKLGIVLACLTFVVLGNLDTWVLWDLLWKKFLPTSFQYFPFILTSLVSPPFLIFIYNQYIRIK